jgi:hypothetical protein
MSKGTHKQLNGAFTKEMHQHQKSFPAHFSNDSKCQFRNPYGLTPGGRASPARNRDRSLSTQGSHRYRDSRDYYGPRDAQGAMGVIALKSHRSKSMLKSSHKRWATFHQFRGKRGRSKLTSAALRQATARHFRRPSGVLTHRHVITGERPSLWAWVLNA